VLATKLADLDPIENPFHDFRNFLYYCFTEVLKFGEPDPIQYRIAEWMQDSPVSDDHIRRLQVQAMRGCGKSVIACCYVAWLYYCNPTIRVVVVSSVQKKANEFAGLVKYLLDNADLLSHLRPDPEADVSLHRGRKRPTLKKQKNAEDAFDVRGCGPGKDPSFAAYPVFGGWTGSHPDIIIPDDTEIPENSLTPLKRERLINKLQECERLIMEGGTILYMGTPQTEESIYDKLDKIGYGIRRWPAELPDPDDPKRARNVCPWLLQRALEEGVGQPSYPERFPAERLVEAKAKGLAHYNLQMLLDTTLADEERYPLKLRNLIVLDVPADVAPTNVVWGTMNPIRHIDYDALEGDTLNGPGFVEDAYAPYQSIVMYIDPKGGGADSVGYCVAAVLNGIIYVLDCGGLAVGRAGGTSEAVMTKLARIAAQWQVKRVIVESNWGGSKGESAYARLLQPVMAKWNGPTQIDLNHVSGQKERRILDDLEPIVNGHRMVWTEKVAKCAALTYQFTHITRDPGSLAHDDELDALHGAVSQFVHLVQLDPEQREQERREAEAIATAKEFERHAKANGLKYGNKNGEDPWRAIRNRRAGAQMVRRGRWRKC
jgi:predicted phage terminase large subunit-like protein